MSEIRDSKNVVAAHIDADGNVIVGDGNMITIINLKEAAQYLALEAEIQELDENFEKTSTKIEKYPDDEDFKVESFQIDEKRTQKRKDLASLKQEVLKLAGEFSRININTERLRLAKDHFIKGEFKEARAVLSSELMGRELEALLIQQESFQQKVSENFQLLYDKSNEYLILARLTAIDFESPNHFEEANTYFEQSLRAGSSIENTFAYGAFLQEYDKFDKALKLYENILEPFRHFVQMNPDNLPELISLLTNIANLYLATGNSKISKTFYEEALNLHKNQKDIDPQKKLNLFATLIFNYSILLLTMDELDLAKSNLYNALSIRRDLAENNPDEFLDGVARVLYHLGLLHKLENQFILAETCLNEALQIRRNLLNLNSQNSMLAVANSLNELANLHQSTNDLDTAKNLYEESLEMYRPLSNANPYANLRYLEGTLYNLANLYNSLNESDSAIAMYEEVLLINRRLTALGLASYLSNVLDILESLSSLYEKRNQFFKIHDIYLKTLEVYQPFSESQPYIYLPYVAVSASKMSIFYLKNSPNKDKSLYYCKVAFKSARPFIYLTDNAHEYIIELSRKVIGTIYKIVTEWEEDFEKFQKEIQ